ncbi:DUF4352 domain-containing protein [Bacillus piscicola]|uniref:DUF4352 domain-containing protein n=1 Tax=Bacillus piscicola TaxID=1632684 RepID=UPI001F08BC99|nr:DUF4352 domain-containing protein [Bacillus piscicola]
MWGVRAFVPLCFLLLCACAQEQNVPRIEETNQTAKAEMVHTERIHMHGIGDQVDVNGLKMTLHGIRINDEVFDHMKPDHDRYIAVKMTAVNHTEKSIQIDPFSIFKLRDGSGTSYNVLCLIDGLSQLFEGTLNPGDKLTGEIPFDTFQSDTYELHINLSNNFGNNKAVWLFTNQDIKGKP